MLNEKMTAAIDQVASAVMSGASHDEMVAVGRYSFELIRDGQVIDAWQDDNLLTTEGRNYILDTLLSGSSYTASWFLSLYTAGSAAAGNTYAAPVVTEVTSSVLATRPAVTWASAASGSKASNTIACNFIGSATVTGCMMLKGVNTIADTATAGGKMLSQAALSASRSVLSGDTLNITYTLTV